MAHYAELNENNIVLRVLTACNQDITNNGGELSEQAANYFGTYTPFSKEGVKWVQTSYNTYGGIHRLGGTPFRKNYAGIGYTYDIVRDAFISPKPFNSWILNETTCLWKAPVAYPTVTTYGDNIQYMISWDEAGQNWIGKDIENNEFIWIPSSASWIATGN
jgi:hypothetical protein